MTYTEPIRLLYFKWIVNLYCNNFLLTFRTRDKQPAVTAEQSGAALLQDSAQPWNPAEVRQRLHRRRLGPQPFIHKSGKVRMCCIVYERSLFVCSTKNSFARISNIYFPALYVSRILLNGS